MWPYPGDATCEMQQINIIKHMQRQLLPVEQCHSLALVGGLPVLLAAPACALRMLHNSLTPHIPTLFIQLFHSYKVIKMPRYIHLVNCQVSSNID
jgi:hypothetical protein